MASGAPELIARLQEICGREHVLTHPHELATYRSDGLGQYQQNPSAVAPFGFSRVDGPEGIWNVPGPVAVVGLTLGGAPIPPAELGAAANARSATTTAKNTRLRACLT